MFKFPVRFFLICLMIFVVFIALCLGCLYLAFSSEPFRMSLNTNASIASTFELKKTLEEESKFIFSGSSEGKREVTFSEQEINSAFNLYVGANQLACFLKKPKPLQKSSLEFRGGSYGNGAFILLISQKLSLETPFGNYLNYYLAVKPSVKNNEFSIVVQKCKVGSITIPSFVINYLFNERKSELNKTKEIKLFVSAVEELRTQTNSVTIIYDPKKLSEFISKYSAILTNNQ